MNILCYVAESEASARINFSVLVCLSVCRHEPIHGVHLNDVTDSSRQINHESCAASGQGPPGSQMGWKVARSYIFHVTHHSNAFFIVNNNEQFFHCIRQMFQLRHHDRFCSGFICWQEELNVKLTKHVLLYLKANRTS